VPVTFCRSIADWIEDERKGTVDGSSEAAHTAKCDRSERKESTVGLMDKVKSQATELAEKSKQGVAQGQAKLDAMQAKKQLDALFHDLGAATYAAERKGGTRDEVERLLKAIDAHEQANGPTDTTGT